MFPLNEEFAVVGDYFGNRVALVEAAFVYQRDQRFRLEANHMTAN